MLAHFIGIVSDKLVYIVRTLPARLRQPDDDLRKWASTYLLGIRADHKAKDASFTMSPILESCMYRSREQELSDACRTVMCHLRILWRMLYISGS